MYVLYLCRLSRNEELLKHNLRVSRPHRAYLTHPPVNLSIQSE